MLSVMVFTSVRLLSIFGTSLYHFRFDADVGIFPAVFFWPPPFGFLALILYLVYSVYVHQQKREIEYCEPALGR